MKLINVCGARPNFMKIAPLMAAYEEHSNIDPVLVHTGQHYDDNMSRLFFDELGIPRPDINLEVGSASHAQQTAAIMVAFESVIEQTQPDAVLVVGDVNSTIACGLVAAKLDIAVFHVEAGLRSFDAAMPEEINRVLTDALSSLLFTTEPSAQENLRREGIAEDRIHFVGNVMIDTLMRHRARAQSLKTHERLGCSTGQYGLVTLHRPSNVDDPSRFGEIVDALEEIQGSTPLIFCIHPRTRGRAQQCGLLTRLEAMPNLHLSEPLGYLEFLNLMADAQMVLTDSGGMQEETTILRVPCLTIRENTERPITISHGSNKLVAPTKTSILEATSSAVNKRDYDTPPLWDGQAATRIAEIIAQWHRV